MHRIFGSKEDIEYLDIGGAYMMFFSKNAKWIGTGAKLDRKTTNTVSPALRLLKEFEVEQYSEAVCYICGLGSYVLYINGKRVGVVIVKSSNIQKPYSECHLIGLCFQ